MAAVGSRNGSVGRPAVILRASVAPDDQEPDQDQHVVAVPEPGPEPPQPRQQHADDEDREQEPAPETGHVGNRFAEAEGIDRLDVDRGQGRAASDEDLALPDRDAHGLDGLCGTGLGGRGEFIAERRIRHDQVADQFRGEHPFRLVETAGHPTGKACSSLGHLRIAQLRAQRGIEDPRRFGPHGCPARGVELDQGRDGPVRQVGHGRLEQRLAVVWADVRGERRVDPRHARFEGDLLGARDGDGVLGRE